MDAFIFAYKAALLALSIVILTWMYREDKRDKEAGKMAEDKMPKVGDKVRGLKSGRTIVVERTYDNDRFIVGFYGDNGEKAYVRRENVELGFGNITESSEQPEEPAQSTADLIANLELRVSELEAQLKRKEGDDMATNGEYRAEKRHAKVGERIVVVDPFPNEDYGKGNIFTVVSVNDVGEVRTDDDELIFASEYEVLPADMPQSERSLDGLLAQVTEENKHRADAVDKPAHYTQGGVETIDYIAQVAGGYADGFVAHCVGTTIKYVSRAPYKHESPAEDLRKARRYLDFAIERLEGER